MWGVFVDLSFTIQLSALAVLVVCCGCCGCGFAYCYQQCWCRRSSSGNDEPGVELSKKSKDESGVERTGVDSAAGNKPIRRWSDIEDGVESDASNTDGGSGDELLQEELDDLWESLNAEERRRDGHDDGRAEEHHHHNLRHRLHDRHHQRQHQQQQQQRDSRQGSSSGAGQLVPNLEMGASALCEEDRAIVDALRRHRHVLQVELHHSLC